MGKEEEMIEIIYRQMPTSSLQVNGLYECDAEIIELGGSRLVYTMDEFSEEDLLRVEDPYTLGWNMAVGCISDILACGGKPLFYAHSFVIQKSWSKEFVEKVSKGISDVLKKLNIAFIGGDFGISDKWRYTGSVIGELKGRPMLRSGAKVGDILFISGRIGIGNMEAALNLYSSNPMVNKITNSWSNRFFLRHQEALLIKEYSCCCIDTSDGVFEALNTISNQSNTGFEIKFLPYDKRGTALSKLLGVPKELLALGECGEYELLFTVDEKLCEEFLKRAKEIGFSFYQIGQVQEQGIRLLHDKKIKLDLSRYSLKARDYDQPKEYIKDMIAFVKKGRSI